MKSRKNLFSATGIPSLFLIFAVLCLGVLSLLTLASSRSALSSARLSMEQTDSYYKACGTATEKLNKIRTSLSGYYKKASDEASYWNAVADLSGEVSDLTEDTSDRTLCFSCAFSDTQELSVKIRLLYPDSADGDFFRILEWKTDTTGQWNPDTSENLYTRWEMAPTSIGGEKQAGISDGRQSPI